LHQYDIPSSSEAPDNTPEQYYRFFASSHNEETQSRNRAIHSVAEYISSYQQFASGVLNEITQEKPEYLAKFDLVCRSSLQQMKGVLDNLKVRTSKDADKVEGVARGLQSYMQGAEYLEDKAAVLAHAMGELKATLEMLDLVRSEVGSGAWSQAVQESSMEQIPSSSVVVRRSMPAEPAIEPEETPEDTRLLVA
jgi:hypothetical protein